MSDLVAIAYPDLATAREVASNVGEAQKAHIIDLEDLVIVERQGDGKIKLHQPSLAGAGAAGGALWGGLIGLIFLAMLSAFANFFFIPYYPFWALLLIALDIWVIWALTRPSAIKT